jgi:biotin carboxyl carrier protein
VVSPSDGVVTEVRVQESSQVQEGDVVVVLDP